MLLVKLRLTTLWDLHRESITDLMVELHSFGKDVYIIQESTDFSIGYLYVFKLGISKKTHLGYLVATKNNEILI